MLRTLRIRNLVIVDDLAVEFGPGLNLLTGETGAGKSILVDALGLISGARADRALIRQGAEEAVVEALFEGDSDPALRGWADDRGIDPGDDGQIIVRRTIRAGSGGRAFVNGSPTTLGVLRELGERLVELHGQHEQHGLLRPERHLELLDRFGGHDLELDRVGLAHERVGQAAARLAECADQAARRGERQDELSRRLAEIDALAPRSGELAQLDRDRNVLRHASRMVELLDDVVGLLYERDGSAAGLAAQAARHADELAQLDPELGEPAGRVRSAAVDLEDVGAAFRDYRQNANLDPAALEQVEARRAAIEQLCLRLGADEQGLIEAAEEARRELAELGSLEEQTAAAGAALEKAEAAYVSAAGKLTRARQKAVARLAPAVVEQLSALAMPRARFAVRLEPARGPAVGTGATPLHPRGAERSEFELAANPGQAAAPLATAASGGELSRVMLALHVAAKQPGDRALVFDEVDAGVGGAVADALGARLAALAREQQVLCVTHLPQIAAYADRHFRVAKRVSAGQTRAEVVALSDESRVEELARMVGGKRMTEASRRHAAELLAGASRPARRRA